MTNKTTTTTKIKQDDKKRGGSYTTNIVRLRLRVYTTYSRSHNLLETESGLALVPSSQAYFKLVVFLTAI